MITKLIRPDSFRFDDPVASIVDIHSKGIDSKWMSKRAAMFDDIKSEIKPIPGKTIIHLITTGAMETYGTNNNGDAFNRVACEVEIPYPKAGSPKIVQLDGGLEKFHNTFLKSAGVYKHHQNNKDPQKRTGDILKEALNKKMDRGELLVALDNDKWSQELDKMAKEEPIFFSIGCGVPHDTCSVCGNQATTRAKYCDHLKHDMLAMTKEGHQVCAYNDKPNFHDISGVFRPADKIAFGLRKVASGVLSSADLAEMEQYTIPTQFVDLCVHGRMHDRLQTLKKLASIEEEENGYPEESPLAIARSAFVSGSGFGSASSQCLEKLGMDIDQSLSEMGRKCVVLPLEDFFRLILGKRYPEAEGHMEDVKSFMPSLFRDVLSSSGLEEFLNDGTYEGTPCLLRNIRDEVGDMVESHSLAAGPVRKRVTIVTIRKEPGSGPSIRVIRKHASADFPANFLAREYGKYLLSFCRDKEEDVQRLAVLQKSV